MRSDSYKVMLLRSDADTFNNIFKTPLFLFVIAKIMFGYVVVLQLMLSWIGSNY